MKKLLLFVLVLSIFSLNGFAKPRTQSEALNIAKSFYKDRVNVKINKSINGLRLVYACTDKSSTRSSEENVFYYVFNNENSGFIIVSGDDRAKDILGYSD